jgi:hypothetical protein
MVDPKIIDEQITISANDARGSLGAKSGTLGDTLLPMLIGMIVLTIVGIFIAFMVIR